MSAGRLARLIRRTGRVAEPAPEPPEPLDVDRSLSGSVQVRHVDAGYERAIEVADERGVRVPMHER
mgnify:CR=1 FL=1